MLTLFIFYSFVITFFFVRLSFRLMEANDSVDRSAKEVERLNWMLTDANKELRSLLDSQKILAFTRKQSD